MNLTALVHDAGPEAVRCCRAVIEARQCGVVRCGVSRLLPPLDGFFAGRRLVFSGDVTALLDAFAAEQDLEPLGTGWRAVNKETARWIMARMLSRSFAYGVPLMDEGQAKTLTDAFLTACARDTPGQWPRFFTNGKGVDGPTMYDVRLRPMLGWNPATGSTFDTGVVVLTRRAAGLMWAEEED